MNVPNLSNPQSPTNAQSASSFNRGGRPCVLSPAQREEILKLLQRGCSRRTVARRIGCAPNTITRTAARDPDFARQLACAETDLELKLLDSIHEAANSGRYWRAAAWSLERRYPDAVAHRSPGTITHRQVAILVAQIAQIIEEEIPAPTLRKNVIKRLESMTRTLRNQQAPPLDHRL
ncbi:MAG: helix-turn-helix domain-containing protein [Thermoguttaceae bacterium]